LTDTNKRSTLKMIAGSAVAAANMTNNTDDIVIVRHVHPGIVHVGDRTFNLNSVFEKNATGIGVGETRRKSIMPVAATTAETRFAPGVYKEGRLKPAQVVGYVNEEKVLNSSRFYYC